MNEQKLVQLKSMPIKMFAVYGQDDGGELRVPVLFAGLTNDGEIEMIEFSPDGDFSSGANARNFLRYEMEG